MSLACWRGQHSKCPDAGLPTEECWCDCGCHLASVDDDNLGIDDS